MALAGKLVEELQNAFIDAFSPDELKRLVLVELNEILDAITPSVDLTQVVFELITWADRHDRLGELVAAAQRQRPNDHEIQRFIDRHGDAIQLEHGARDSSSVNLATSAASQNEIPEPNRKLRVFLCHASEDKETVRKLHHWLKADGLDPWLDEESLLPGQEWQREIPRAVRNADAVLVCLSNSSLDKDGYVQNEIRFALDEVNKQPDDQIYLIPVRLEDCQVPANPKRWQYSDIFEDRGYARLIDALRMRSEGLGLRGSIGLQDGSSDQLANKDATPSEERQSVASYDAPDAPKPNENILGTITDWDQVKSYQPDKPRRKLPQVYLIGLFIGLVAFLSWTYFDFEQLSALWQSGASTNRVASVGNTPATVTATLTTSPASVAATLTRTVTTTPVPTITDTPVPTEAPTNTSIPPTATSTSTPLPQPGEVRQMDLSGVNIMVGMKGPGDSNPFWAAVEKGATDKGEELGVNVTVISPPAESDFAAQIAQVEDQIAVGIDAIIIAVIDPAALQPILGLAAGEGVPVICIDTQCNVEGALTYIGTDNQMGASIAAQYICDNVEAGSDVAILQGIVTQSTGQQRAEGSKAGFDACGLKVVAERPANWDRDEGQTLMENILTANPLLSAVFASNDNMALGAIEALKSAGVLEKVIVVGFDANPDAATSVLAGEMSATLAQNPYNMGAFGVENAVKALMGEQIDEVIDSGTVLVTEDNAAYFE